MGYLLRRHYTSQYPLTFWSREEVGIHLFSLPNYVPLPSVFCRVGFLLRILRLLPPDWLEHVPRSLAFTGQTSWKCVGSHIPLPSNIIKSLNPSILNFHLNFHLNLHCIKLSEQHQLTDRLWVTEILFTNPKLFSFILKIFFNGNYLIFK